MANILFFRVNPYLNGIGYVPRVSVFAELAEDEARFFGDAAVFVDGFDAVAVGAGGDAGDAEGFEGGDDGVGEGEFALAHDDVRMAGEDAADTLLGELLHFFFGGIGRDLGEGNFGVVTVFFYGCDLLRWKFAVWVVGKIYKHGWDYLLSISWNFCR